MALYFGGRAGHSEQFCGEFETCAIVEHNDQCTMVLCEADFNWPGLRHGRLWHPRDSVRSLDDRHVGALSIPRLPRDAPWSGGTTKLHLHRILTTLHCGIHDLPEVTP